MQCAALFSFFLQNLNRFRPTVRCSDCSLCARLPLTYSAQELGADGCNRSFLDGQTVDGFVGVLDYIMASNTQLTVCSTLRELPFESTLWHPPGKFGFRPQSGISSHQYPSDHIALACEFEWIQNDDACDGVPAESHNELKDDDAK